MWAEICTADASHFHRLLHRITPERLAKLLIKHDFDKGRNALLLCLASLLQRCRNLGLCADSDAFEATTLGNAGIREMRIKLGAHEIIIIPERRIALFGAPLIITENYHRNGGPLLAANRAHFRHRDTEGTITGKANDWNIGIANFPELGRDTGKLLMYADIACRIAASDEQGYHVYRLEDHEETESYSDLGIELDKAIRTNELRVSYQPQVDIKTGRCVSAEALVRWTHPLRGPVPPSEFIPLAEETGLINRIGEFVLRTACWEAASWDHKIGVAVNLSAAQFHGEDLPMLVTRVLAETGLSPHRLELEITESILIEDKEVVMRKLSVLRALGVRIALDDFGTGYSSLAYLSSFPFDKIKIDRSFVRDVTQRPDAAAIIRAILGLARTLQMSTTAEGIEKAEELAWLRDQGCHQAQGFLFSRPVAAAEFRALLDRGPFFQIAQAA